MNCLYHICGRQGSLVSDDEFGVVPFMHVESCMKLET